MKIINREEDIYLIRLDIGDKFPESLVNVCRDENITSSVFSAIGACKDLTLSFFDIENKMYADRKFAELLEIVSLTGNVATINNEIMIHSHGVFSNNMYSTIGGHVKKFIVSATCEIFLTKLKDKVKKAYDENTGLNLLN